jgi:8-oxo-dGTP pyrophosphatase MutT (NUDIX family)
MALPRILNPQAIPHAGTDAHLPAIAAEWLTAAALRQRFTQVADWVPELAGDGHIANGRAPSAAAVLVPLVQRADGLQVLLTKRSEQLRDHAGQISFPGGRSEASDVDAADTALREAEEEIGLPRDRVDVIGQLPPYTTVTQYVVTPVVALVTPPFLLTLDGFEVAEAFEVPLSFLMTPAHHRRHLFTYEGGERQFLSMPWPAMATDGTSREHFIWGATAAMLRNLYHFLSR